MSEPLPNLDRDAPGSDDARWRTARLNLRAIITGALFIAIIGLVTGILHARAPARAEVESTRIDIAARVSSRLAKVPVARRQDVAAGATPMLMDNPELVAQLHEAEAETLVGDAELARINVGARAEIIAQRKAEIDRAAAYLTLAQQTYITEPSSSPPTSLAPYRSSTRTATR